MSTYSSPESYDSLVKTINFARTAQVGDTFHTESDVLREVEDLQVTSVTENPGSRTIIARSLLTAHKKRDKALTTTLGSRHYTVSTNELSLSFHRNTHITREATTVARYSKKALNAQHANYKGAELS